MEESTIWKAENALFEMICSNVDVFSYTEGLDVSSLIAGGLTYHEVKTALENLRKMNLIRNVVIGYDEKVSCQITTDGLRRFHGKVRR